MGKLRYAVIGTSKITAQYISAVKTTQQWELCAVFSRTEQTGATFAKEQNIPNVFTNLEQFAKSDLFDAVYIASPNLLHYGHCKLMLENGKHVICEKPFTSYLWQMQELFEIAKQKNLVLLEAIMFMHQPAKLELEKAIEQIGDVKMVLFDNCRRSQQYDKLLNGEIPNIFNPILHTGALMDMGVYCVYPALALFGRPQSITANAVCHKVGTDICGVISLQYPEKVVELRYSKCTTSAIGSEILGENGHISIGSILHVSDIVLHQNEDKSKVIWRENSKDELMANEAIRFAEFILNAEENKYLYENCKQTSLMVCEVLQSIRKEIGLDF